MYEYGDSCKTSYATRDGDHFPSAEIVTQYGSTFSAVAIRYYGGLSMFVVSNIKETSSPDFIAFGEMTFWRLDRVTKRLRALVSMCSS